METVTLRELMFPVGILVADSVETLQRSQRI